VKSFLILLEQIHFDGIFFSFFIHFPVGRKLKNPSLRRAGTFSFSDSGGKRLIFRMCERRIKIALELAKKKCTCFSLNSSPRVFGAYCSFLKERKKA
jgi:hypothetical protein